MSLPAEKKADEKIQMELWDWYMTMRCPNIKETIIGSLSREFNYISS